MSLIYNVIIPSILGMCSIVSSITGITSCQSNKLFLKTYVNIMKMVADTFLPFPTDSWLPLSSCTFSPSLSYREYCGGASVFTPILYNYIQLILLLLLI